MTWPTRGGTTSSAVQCSQYKTYCSAKVALPSLSPVAHDQPITDGNNSVLSRLSGFDKLRESFFENKTECFGTQKYREKVDLGQSAADSRGAASDF